MSQEQKGLLEQAIDYHQQGDYKNSVKYLKQAADLQNPIAMYLLAVSLREGWGEVPDVEKAVALLRDCVNIIVSDLENQYDRPVSTQVMNHAKKLVRRPSEIEIASLHNQGLRASSSSRKISTEPIKIVTQDAKSSLNPEKPKLKLSDTIERHANEESAADLDKSGTILRAILKVKIEESPKSNGFISRLKSRNRSGSGSNVKKDVNNEVKDQPPNQTSTANGENPTASDTNKSPKTSNPPSQELKNKSEAKTPTSNEEPKGINEFLRSILSLPLLDLGYSYLFGWGVDINPRLSVYYFDIAALLGDSDAQLQLGYMFEHGLRIKKDKQQAAKYYRMYTGEIPQLSWIWKDKYNVKFENVDDTEIIEKLKNVPVFEVKKNMFWSCFCCCF
jgi:Sel1 repeat